MSVSPREWAMQRMGPGDWLCWSNDRTTVWRFHHHVDGAAHGLCDHEGRPVAYTERTYWRAVYMGADDFRAEVLRAAESDDYPDVMGPWGPLWTEAAQYLPTRQAAIDTMLTAGAVASTP